MNEIDEIIEIAADGLDVISDSNDKKGCFTIVILVVIVVIIIWLWNR